MSERQIVAGSAWLEDGDGKTVFKPTIKYCLALTKSIDGFYEAAKHEPVEPSHLQLFPMPNHLNIEEFLLSQDVIWVDWGSVANLLAAWRTHGLDKILRRAWDSGVILSGVSAGALCWGVGGTTDSFGKELQPFTNGLGFLPYSFGVHYDSEANRRPLLHKLIEDGTLPEGYATDDGVSLHFIDTKLHKAVTETPEKYAYHVYKNQSGQVEEEKIQPEQL
jgi:peptidase E